MRQTDNVIKPSSSKEEMYYRKNINLNSSTNDTDDFRDVLNKCCDMFLKINYDVKGIDLIKIK